MTILINEKYCYHGCIVIIVFFDPENIILHTKIIRIGYILTKSYRFTSYNSASWRPFCFRYFRYFRIEKNDVSRLDVIAGLLNYMSVLLVCL